MRRGGEHDEDMPHLVETEDAGFEVEDPGVSQRSSIGYSILEGGQGFQDYGQARAPKQSQCASAYQD